MNMCVPSVLPDKPKVESMTNCDSSKLWAEVSDIYSMSQSGLVYKIMLHVETTDGSCQEGRNWKKEVWITWV